jgi:DNA-binding PadR family transcriptional regulator
MNPESSADLLPLPAAQLHILLALADGEKHGYAIMSEVEVMTGGSVTMGPGTLYGTVKRMLKAGLLEEIDERPDPELDDQRRRYYRLTGFGARVLDAEVARMEQLARTAERKRPLGTRRLGLEGR